MCPYRTLPDVDIVMVRLIRIMDLSKTAVRVLALVSKVKTSSSTSLWRKIRAVAVEMGGRIDHDHQRQRVMAVMAQPLFVLMASTTNWVPMQFVKPINHVDVIVVVVYYLDVADSETVLVADNDCYCIAVVVVDD
jgi:hypothetical protein